MSSPWLLCLKTSGLAPFRKHKIGCTWLYFPWATVHLCFLAWCQPATTEHEKHKMYKDHSVQRLSFHWGPNFPFSTSPISRYSAAASSFPSILQLQRFLLYCDAFNNILLYFLLVLILLYNSTSITPRCEQYLLRHTNNIRTW